MEELGTMTSHLPAPALGPHPGGLPWQDYQALDGSTDSGVAHRALTANGEHDAAAVARIREMLERHHAAPDTLQRDRERRDALLRLGHAGPASKIRRFPRNGATRKGNLAEVVLAEYLVATTHASFPIYRLRYNPNVDQSMKGDDVLAFDLDADPVRIIVGEAKFRGTSSKAAVEEMVAGLVRSNLAGLPASLAFVADRLYETNQIALADQIMNCVILFAEDRIRLDYIGLLMSDLQSATRVNRHTPADLHRLVVVSLGLAQPDALVDACYEGSE
ncbi:Hachiman antiphage defense system protein HamA (plasmid) [Cupriavidus basilensis]